MNKRRTTGSARVYIPLVVLMLVAMTAAQPWAAEYYQDPGDTIRLTPQSPTFGIELAAAPTDGQVWTIQRIDRDLIRMVSSRFEAGSDTQIWLFHVRDVAAPTGFQTEIEFIYRRLATGAPAQTAVFRVVNYAPQ